LGPDFHWKRGAGSLENDEMAMSFVPLAAAGTFEIRRSTCGTAHSGSVSADFWLCAFKIVSGPLRLGASIGRQR
jgi:hypothetical protein